MCIRDSHNADQVMLVAAHNQDLLAAKSYGLKTAFVLRSNEYGPSQDFDLEAGIGIDLEASDFIDFHEGELLFNRFKNRVGVIIDMEKLKQYYDNLNVEWKDVCGINKIYTVIFLKPIPPHAIIARDRVVVDDKILSPGKIVFFRTCVLIKN